ncbi:hypothetical protein Pcaca05_24580 [Pectobacterium carotovorum subsp. carotovorum]|nr:hypothetical protein Pcaca05_24580 [Pectobacterium carotovorum subsp. carotovorum]
MSFSGLSILFIGIGFYDYEHAIVERLEQRGGRVDYWADTPSILRKKPWGGIVFRIPNLAKYLQKKHEDKILAKIADKTYDKVFFIKGVDISEDFIIKLKGKLIDSDFVLYEWDSIERNPILLKRFKYFDYVYSFDRKDANEYSFIRFRPLFFRKSEKRENIKYDIVFIGLMHSSRLEIVRDIQKQAENLNLNMYVYMTTSVLTWMKLFLIGSVKNLHIRNLPYEKVIEINRSSFCVLDLPHPGQTGLTMRTIESLGADMKIITTSNDIRNYDFFDDSMIDIINTHSPKINLTFFSSRENESIYSNHKSMYSLDSWLNDVFNVEESDKNYLL